MMPVVPHISINSRKIARTLAFIAVALVVFSVSVSAYEVISGTEILNKLDVDWEGSLPSYFSSLLLIGSSVLLGIIAFHKKANRDDYSLHWLGLSIIFFLLSIDETVAIHEGFVYPLQDLLGASGFFYYAWVIPGIICVGIFGLAYWRFVMHLPPKARKLFILAGMIFLSGAIGMELIGGKWADTIGIENLVYVLIVTVEESLEMTGIVVFIYALLQYLKTLLPNIHFSLSVPD